MVVWLVSSGAGLGKRFSDNLFDEFPFPGNIFSPIVLEGGHNLLV